MSHRRRKSNVRGGALLGISDSVAAADSAAASQFDVCVNSSVVIASKSVSHNVCLQSAFIVVSSSATLRRGLNVCTESTASMCPSDVVDGFSDPPATDDILPRYLNASRSSSTRPAELTPADLQQSLAKPAPASYQSLASYQLKYPSLWKSELCVKTTLKQHETIKLITIYTKQTTLAGS